MNVTIYLTPFKKILPENNTTVLSAEHVNTAFTFACEPEGEITIFREEEWFKVFLHESFHSYGLDFALSESTILRKTIEKVFHIKSDFNVNEAYTETWARIINCALFSFDNKDKEQTYVADSSLLFYKSSQGKICVIDEKTSENFKDKPIC